MAVLSRVSKHSYNEDPGRLLVHSGLLYFLISKLKSLTGDSNLTGRMEAFTSIEVFTLDMEHSYEDPS